MNGFKLSLILLILLLTPASSGTVRAQDSDQLFDAMLELSGTDYNNARDEFLKEPDVDLLQSKLDGTPAEWIQASILLGWIDHEQRYRELINTPTITSRDLEEHYPWAGRELLDRFAGPLLVEIVLKGGSHENAKSDAADSLRKMVRGGINVDSRFFTIPLRSEDNRTRRLLASVVSELPVSSSPQLFNDLNEHFQTEEDVIVNRIILSGLATQSAALTDEMRNEFATGLNNEAQLDRLGRPVVYSALTEIGGDSANGILRAHVERSLSGDDELAKRDAVQTLMRMSNGESVDRLINVATNNESPEWLRKMVHGGLADVPYEEKIKLHLLNVAQDNRLSESERSEAVSALGQIQVELNSLGQETRDITETFSGILEGGVEDQGFQKILRDSYQQGMRIDR